MGVSYVLGHQNSKTPMSLPFFVHRIRDKDLIQVSRSPERGSIGPVARRAPGEPLTTSTRNRESFPRFGQFISVDQTSRENRH